MKTSLPEIIAAAQKAVPENTQHRASWRQFLPVIKVLMEQRGFNLAGAVKWLVSFGEIGKEQEVSAYRALRQCMAREEAKKKRKEAE